jgi:hypothetical protein
MTWQPIKTAPKDATEILLWCSDEGTIRMGWFTSLKWVGGYMAKECDPTHWMPLPLPPQETTNPLEHRRGSN